MIFLRPDRLSGGGSLSSLLLGRRWPVPVAFALPFVAVPPLLFHFRRTGRWCPGAAVHPVLAFERRVPTAITKHLAFRMMVVLGATL